jgi:hypothetical protein
MNGFWIVLSQVIIKLSKTNQVLLWSWSYGSWIYNYLCNQCPSPLTLLVGIPLMTLCTRHYIITSLSVTWGIVYSTLHYHKFVSDLGHCVLDTTLSQVCQWLGVMCTGHYIITSLSVTWGIVYSTLHYHKFVSDLG